MKQEVTIPLVVGRIIGNEIRQTRFEGNTGGDLYCQYVDEKLQEQDYKCSCTSRKAPNKVEKLSKIIAYSGDVKRKFIFLDMHRPTQEQMKKDSDLGVTRYYRNDEYQAAMDELSMFVSIGGNEHDDAADGFAICIFRYYGTYAALWYRLDAGNIKGMGIKARA